ncbi:MAG: GatB/YqeY domain-containing protein [Candidatus Paceibacterota bacterium]
MLQEKIEADLKKAMTEKDELRKSVLRNIKSEATNELVSQKRKPTEQLEEDDLIQVITRLAKQRKDSIEQFRKGNRPNLAEKEEKELKILEEYLPEQLSDEELRSIVEEKKEETGAESIADMGKLMGVVMSEVKGRADGNRVKDIVQDVLN